MRHATVVLLSFLFFPIGAARADADPAQGKVLYEQKCTACHSIGGGPRVGPDLQGVSQRRSEDWMLRFITHPDRLIAEKDATALALYERFNRIVMPNLGLSDAQARALIAHLKAVGGDSAATQAPVAAAALPRPEMVAPQSIVFGMFVVLSALIALTFAWVGFSTREPEQVDVKKAYGLRRALFFSASALAVVVLVATLPGAPYAMAGAKPDRIVYVAARQFDFLFSEEPITDTGDVGQVPTLQHPEFPAGSLIEFRVTSLDVNHAFGVYGPERQLVAQTQAMPGYVNRLRVNLAHPGDYKVFCLEYCAAGHHAMQSGFVVK